MSQQTPTKPIAVAEPSTGEAAAPIGPPRGVTRPAGRGVARLLRWPFQHERHVRLILMLLACVAVGALAVITGYIFKEGLPIMLNTGVGKFLFSSDWYPLEKPPSFGIFAMIVGSLAVTGGAMVIGVSFGLGCAILLTQFCPPRMVTVLKPAVELLAGIPSVVYGAIGMVVLVPLIRTYLGGPGLSVLAASIVLGIMVLPTMTSISIDALRAVPRAYHDGSIALGATGWQTTHMVMLKAARSGIVSAAILSMGRAVGETMAVIMVAGNSPDLPNSILAPVRTLTSNIALEMGYSQGEHKQALFATGVTLFMMIMVLNILALRLSGQRRRKGGAA